MNRIIKGEKMIKKIGFSPHPLVETAYKSSY